MTSRSSRAIAIAAMTFLFSGPVFAHDPGLGRCLAMPDKEERLACYDRIARADQAVADSGSPVPSASRPIAPRPADAAPAAEASSSPRADFGFGAAEREERRAPDRQQLDDVVVRVKEAREVGAGYWQFGMDDGSVWRLSEVRASFRPPRRDDEVRLKRASLGSYLLVFRNQPSMLIKRVQ